jgi:hypothetical protein
VDVTAIGSTEGADEKFPVWDVFRRIPHISVSFAPIQMNLARSSRLIHTQLVIERNWQEYFILIGL